MQMEVRVVLKATGFIGLVAVGLPANLSVLLLFCRLHMLHSRLSPNDIILGNLASVNLVVLLSRGIPQTLVALGMRRLFGDVSCKVNIFSYRLARALSICITALLGCYQCVAVAPSTPHWAKLKRWLPTHIPHAILLFCAINFLVSSGSYLFSVAPPANGSIPEYTINLEFCIVIFPDLAAYVANGVMYTLRDLVFVCVMVAAAAYMLLVLYRHRKQVEGLRGAGRASAEASKAVLLLLCTYVSLFGLDNTLWAYTLTVSRVPPAISDARVFFASCYSALSPVLIIATNRRLAEGFRGCFQTKGAAKAPSTQTESSTTHVTGA
ncbi:olfactory receptor class A-like protein 1 [Paramormyrops kingsleyae]|uniref:olfactory receptor class A-like protein 1 n=1 Tax=Paramormyrops kingsleyae TaxID=1676925 RepID=UPI000CD5F799|nr:vomeronasal type-1 receptor 4-like [Paramormyrops kingsleyae]